MAEMKGLCSYILESYGIVKRERAGDLPFTLEEFQMFIEAIRTGDYDDAEIWHVIESAVTGKYGETAFRCLVGYVEGNCNFRDVPRSSEKLYKDLQRFPLDRLKKLLGAGSYGSVLDIGNGRVMKWYHEYGRPAVTDYKIDHKFYTYLYEHPKHCKFFPNVYKVTDKYIILEKLKPCTEKCDEYYKFIYNIISSQVVKDFVRDGMSKCPDEVKSLIRKDKKYADMWQWHFRVCLACQDMGIDYPGDICGNNMGERKDGTVVWFDP